MNSAAVGTENHGRNGPRNPLSQTGAVEEKTMGRASVSRDGRQTFAGGRVVHQRPTLRLDDRPGNAQRSPTRKWHIKRPTSGLQRIAATTATTANHCSRDQGRAA